MSVLAIPCGDVLSSHSSTQFLDNERSWLKTPCPDRPESTRKNDSSTVHRDQEKSAQFQKSLSVLYASREANWTKHRNENTGIQCPSSIHCDSVLQYVNLADFKDGEKLRKYFEDVLRIQDMDFPLKILKRNWCPGLVCIPIFHCRRCLALWTKASEIPTQCPEVDRGVNCPLMSFSVTKCDFLGKKIVAPDREREERRLFKQKPFADANKVSTNTEAVKEKGKPKDVLRFEPISMAQFVDIDEEVRKYQEKYLSRIKQSRKSGKVHKKGTNIHDEEISAVNVVDLFTAAKMEEKCDSADKGRLESGNEGRLDQATQKTMASAMQGKLDFPDERIADSAMEKSRENCGKWIFDDEISEEKTERIELKSKSDSVSLPDEVEKMSESETFVYERSRSSSGQNKTGYSGKPPTRLDDHFKRRLAISGRQSRSGSLSLSSPSDMKTKIRTFSRQFAKIRRPPYQPADQVTAPPDIRVRIPDGTEVLKRLRKTSHFTQPSWQQFAWVKMLRAEMQEKEANLKSQKREFTRAFCFSYFGLLRKVEALN